MISAIFILQMRKPRLSELKKLSMVITLVSAKQQLWPGSLSAECGRCLMNKFKRAETIGCPLEFIHWKPCTLDQ